MVRRSFVRMMFVEGRLSSFLVVAVVVWYGMLVVACFVVAVGRLVGWVVCRVWMAVLDGEQGRCGVHGTRMFTQ